jgi:hypothetical protein
MEDTLQRDIETNSGSQDQLKDALLFAEQLAKREIESIERIHKRTLQSFGYIGAFAAAVLAVFGYIGYANLKDASIATASAQMQKEVTMQVREKLTTENINQIVRDQIRDLSATNLTAEIHRELTSPPLSSSIRQAADEEAQRQIRKQFSPRHFSPAQSKQLIGRLADMKELYSYSVAVNPALFNVEAITYATEIRESLSHSKMKIIEFASFDKPPIEGVGIYYDEQQPDTYARQLQEALKAAGVVAKLVPGKIETPVPGPGQKSPLEIFVGSKPMQ